MGCDDKLNTGHFITLQGVEQETAVDTQNKTTEKQPKVTANGALKRLTSLAVVIGKIRMNSPKDNLLHIDLAIIQCLQ